ncbi:MAG: helix-turn-helix domain-containing protein [Anaeromyxobacteraceae bacterium]
MTERGGSEREALLQGAAGFGRWLHQERELRALSRDEVARLTKLAPAVIDALESGDPDRMPPKAYVFGYLRSYAAAVGLDADDVVLRWQEVVGPEGSAIDAPRPRPVPWRAILAALAVAALVLAAAYALFAPREPQRLRLDRTRPGAEQAIPPADSRPPR